MSWLNELRDGAAMVRAAGFSAGPCTGTETKTIDTSLIVDGSNPGPGCVLGWHEVTSLSDPMNHPNSVPLSPASLARRGGRTIGLFTNAVVEFTIAAFVLLCVVKDINANTKNLNAALPA